MIVTTYRGGNTRPAAAAVTSAAKSNPTLARAVAAVPSVDDLTAQLAALTEQAAPLSVTGGTEAVDAEVRASLAAGQGLPPDLLRRYADAAAAGVAFGTAQENLSALHTQLSAERDNALIGGLPTMLAVLEGELHPLLADLVKALPKLGGITTAEAAIDAAKVDQWSAVAKLHADYRSLRAAQQTLMATTTPREQWTALSKAWPTIGQAAGLVTVWPDMPEWLKYGVKLDSHGNRVRLTAPWPDPATDAFADWLAVTPAAQPWVPTPDQASQLLEQIDSSTRRITERENPDIVADRDLGAAYARLRH